MPSFMNSFQRLHMNKWTGSVTRWITDEAWMECYEDYSEDNAEICELGPLDQIIWCHDFNYSPMSSAICKIEGDKIKVCDEIVMDSSVAANVAVEFVDRYKLHLNKNLKLYGDPAGKAGEKHGQQSNYTVLVDILTQNGWFVERCVKSAAPAIRDRQNAVRAKICDARGHRRLFVNPKKAPTAHRGLFSTQLKEGSSFLEIEDRSQHITTALGYFIDFVYPVSMNVASETWTPANYVF